MDFTLKHYGVEIPQGKLVFTYRLVEEETGEEYGRWLNIFLCELPRLKDVYANDLNPLEQWFAILRNLPNFAHRPAWLKGRYERLLNRARPKGLTTIEQTQYLRAMITDYEKEDIAKAYLRRGREEGREEGLEVGREEGREEERAHSRAAILGVAKSLLASGMSVTEVSRHTGIPEKDLEGIPHRT